MLASTNRSTSAAGNLLLCTGLLALFSGFVLGCFWLGQPQWFRSDPPGPIPRPAPLHGPVQAPRRVTRQRWATLAKSAVTGGLVAGIVLSLPRAFEVNSRPPPRPLLANPALRLAAATASAIGIGACLLRRRADAIPAIPSSARPSPLFDERNSTAPEPQALPPVPYTGNVSDGAGNFSNDTSSDRPAIRGRDSPYYMSAPAAMARSMSKPDLPSVFDREIRDRRSSSPAGSLHSPDEFSTRPASPGRAGRNANTKRAVPYARTKRRVADAGPIWAVPNAETNPSAVSQSPSPPAHRVLRRRDASLLYAPVARHSKASVRRTIQSLLEQSTEESPSECPLALEIESPPGTPSPLALPPAALDTGVHPGSPADQCITPTDSRCIESPPSQRYQVTPASQLPSHSKDPRRRRQPYATSCPKRKRDPSTGNRQSLSHVHDLGPSAPSRHSPPGSSTPVSPATRVPLPPGASSPFSTPAAFSRRRSPATGTAERVYHAFTKRYDAMRFLSDFLQM